MAFEEKLLQTFRAMILLSILACTLCHIEAIAQQSMSHIPQRSLQTQTALAHSDHPSSITAWRGIDLQETDNGTHHETAMRPVSSQGDLTGPCKYLSHQNDNVVVCSTLGLTKLNPRWFPLNTTTLLLAHNSFKVIPNSTFSHLVRLRILRLSHNKILRIQPNAFQGLENLEILDLENNRLLFSNTTYPDGIFKPLKRLKQLYLKNNAFSRAYPDQLFSGLKNLEYLSLDTAGDEVQLGEQFAALPNLFKLELTGKTKIISNTTFVNVKHLKFLFIHHCRSITNFSHSALEPLQNLEVFSLDHVMIGVNEALHILKPLALRRTNIKMKLISFVSVYRSPVESVTDVDEGSTVLDRSNTLYLRNICVEKIKIVKSRIMIVRTGALISEVWRSCLKVIDVSDNPLVNSFLPVLLFLNSMPNLEEIIVSKHLKRNQPSYTFIDEAQNAQWLHGLDYDNREPVQNYALSPLRGNNTKGLNPLEKKNSSLASRDSQAPKAATSNVPCSGIISKLSDSLRVVQLSGRFGYIEMNKDICIYAKSLMVINVSYCGITHFTGVIAGLSNLQTLDISGNDLSLLSESFLDPLNGLMDLRIANCKLDPNFMILQSARLFSKLHDLQKLDLASNSLSLLENGIFSTNINLRQLSLAGNKFTEIPFDLKDTQRLQVLDLRGNIISTLPPAVTEMLDALAKQNDGFTLYLDQNVLSCACDNFQFLQWLQTTAVSLDKDGNYTCIGEKGRLSYTATYKDLHSVWRKCYGGVFLSVSIILLFTIILGFLTFFVIWKNSTFFISALFFLFTPLKRRDDYRIGAFIGYAENDYRFPCFVLRGYFENTLQLSTYLHHRDMPAAADIATSIVDAINDSWRIVLVITESFLQEDEWSSFTWKSAIYAQDPKNPFRVVVLVDERLRHLLPRDLVRAVPEDNIVVMSGMQLNYEIKETLRTRLVRG